MGLERGTSRKRSLVAREVAREQGRGWRKRKAGRDIHWDRGSKKEREEKCQRRRRGKRWKAREAYTQEQGEAECCEREYTLEDRREERFHGGE